MIEAERRQQAQARRAELAAIGDLRSHTARGTVINGAYQIFLSGVGLLQRLVAAAFLTKEEFGLWAVILTVLINLAWLKELGIMDKYIQQSEPDQELAFQRAFTIELLSSFALLALIAVALPLWALAYGQAGIIPAGLLAAVSIPIAALQAPTWIPYRRLQYRRQRALTAVPVLTGFVVTIAAAVAGAGYWCFIAGLLVGNTIGGIVCVWTSPYRLRLRGDWQTARGYVSFSWPLVASGLSALILVQGSLLIVNHNVGLAGVGAVGLVFSVVTFAQRVDTVVSQTIYPAVCAVVDRAELLREIFVKSNRVALIWALPFSVGLALFAGDLITFVLGERWRSAETLLQIVALQVGFGQIAFNWVMFYRAVGHTRPLFVAAATNVVVTLAVMAVLTASIGLDGYGIALAVAMVVQVALRSHYMSSLLGGFAVVRHTLRAVAPVLPPVTAVLIVRVVSDGDRPLWWALAEFTLYAIVAVAATGVLERRLVREILGYIRSGGRRPSFQAG